MNSQLSPGMAVLAIVAALAVLVLQFFLSGATDDQQDAEVGRVQLAQAVIAPTAVGTDLYWIQNKTVVRLAMDEHSQAETVGSLPHSAADAIWSPDGSAVIIRTADHDQEWVQVRLTGTAKATTLDRGIVYPAFAADSSKILYSYSGISETPLAIAQPDGTNWNNLFAPSHAFLKLWWPGTGAYALGTNIYTDPPSYVRIFISSQRTETIAHGVDDTLESKASPDGDHLVIDRASNTDRSLRLVSLSQGSVQTLDLMSTVARTAWESDTVLITITDAKTVTRVDTSSRTATALGQLENAETINQLVAATESFLFVIEGEALVRIPLDSLTAVTS